MLEEKRSIIFAVILTISYIIWGSTISLTPPFYPGEAEKKGATPSQYGFVFGINNLATTIATPLFGAYLKKIGERRLFVSGAFGIAVATFSFGWLHYVQDTRSFITLSYLIRFLGGIANSAALVTGNSMLTAQFPDNLASLFALLNMCQGLGYITGPPLGSYLYEYGGFTLPFTLFGSIASLCAIALLFSAPDQSFYDDDNTLMKGNKILTFKIVLKSPSIWIAYLDIFTACLVSGFIESMLAPFMKNKFNSSQIEIGMTLFIMGSSFMIVSPLFGILSDLMRYPVILTLIGNTLASIALLFLGPAPFLNIDSSIELLKVMVGLDGMMFSNIMVSTCRRAILAASNLGYVQNVANTFVLAGGYSIMFTLGNFIGPTVSGFLVEAYGFEWTTVIFCGLTTFLVLVNVMELVYNLKSSEPVPNCKSKCICFFIPQGVTIATKQDDETIRLIYKSKDP